MEIIRGQASHASDVLNDVLCALIWNGSFKLLSLVLGLSQWSLQTVFVGVSFLLQIIDFTCHLIYYSISLLNMPLLDTFSCLYLLWSFFKNTLLPTQFLFQSPELFSQHVGFILGQTKFLLLQLLLLLKTQHFLICIIINLFLSLQCFLESPDGFWFLASDLALCHGFWLYCVVGLF